MTTQTPKMRGILTALPCSLPFHPYNDDYPSHRISHNKYKYQRRRAEEVRHHNDPEGATDNFITDEPIYPSNTDDDSFTLFLFVDGANRQSLLAISVVSKWFQYALKNRGDIDGSSRQQNSKSHSGSRVICIPNHSTENNRNSSMLHNTGFYELPFDHASRLTLLHLMNATRVPSIVVVRNNTGRIITHLGWEAIEREGMDGGPLDVWIKRNAFDVKKGMELLDYNDFDSRVVGEWRKGRSGLPCWWHVLSCLF